MYLNGKYYEYNPTWDAEDAPWKADLIFDLIHKHRLQPETICEIGCGSGEILKQLQQKMSPNCIFIGYEISPHAFEFCRLRSNERLIFRLKNFFDDPDSSFDLILLIDLIEHLEDYFKFLRGLKNKSPYVILHIPLEMFVLSALHPKFLLGQRQKVGHLHYFSKDTSLQILRELGYEVIDYSYTPGFTLPRNYGVKDKLLKIPRRLFFPIFKDFTVRIFGGYSLLVLVKNGIS